MRAFVGVLRKYGWNYTPQFISERDFNQIISSKHETGMKNKGENKFGGHK